MGGLSEPVVHVVSILVGPFLDHGGDVRLR